MTLAAGTKLGPYEVTAPLGAGGMGEVYRAHDARLGRDVAVKVLPASFAADADRLRRFEQEARATSALNHPNILAIHDLGSYEGAPYVVSELLEGETLRDRIGATPLPLRKAIDYRSQVARGLAAADEKGIVHRDLKPDNLFVTRDGRVKILDFGLAKLVCGEMLTEGETNTAGLAKGTDAGKVLGTVGYMSPEQVRAPVDHRSDVFSFGAVLYEMLSGKRAFRGGSAVETMNAILKEDPPPLTQTNRQLPPGLERIVSHCLEKSPEERFQSARDIAFDLEQLSGSETSQTALGPVAERGFRRWRLLAVSAGALLLAATAYLAGRRSAPVPPLPEFRPITFQRGLIGNARFAADGRSIVYAAQWPGVGGNLYVAQPGSPESRSLALENAALVGVSRSGELAVLLQHGLGPGRTLARLPMGGGAPRDVTERVLAADWGPDGTSFAVVRSAGGKNVIEFPIGKPLYDAVYVDNVRVSPRGDQVAFSAHPIAGDNRGDVAGVDLAGNRRTLSTGWSDIRGLVWSPDGREIWFTATRAGIELNLWGVTLDGRERQVYRAPGNLQIQDRAPDGRVLLSVGRNKPSLFGLAPGAVQERDLSWLDFGWATDLSADGKTFLFGEQGDGGGPEYSVYVRGTDASAPTLLGKGAAIALSPDRRSALVLDMTPPAALRAASDRRWRPATPATRHADAASMGNLLRRREADRAGRERGRQGLAALGPGPGRRRSKSDLPGRRHGPDCRVRRLRRLPDGYSIAVATDTGAALYPVVGGEPLPVKGAAATDLPLRFSADGRFLYVRAVPRGQAFRLPARVFRIDLAKGTRELWKELSPAGSSSLGGITALVIAPDAGAYAYTYGEAVTTLYEVRGVQ